MDAPSSGSIAGKVLVVDDDRGVAASVQQALSEDGLKSAWARSGEEALRLCAVSTPRAIVLDGLLPGMRGDEVAKRLRLSLPAKTVPIVFVSAFFRDPRSYEALAAAGVDAILHKPIDPDALRRTVRSLLGMSTLASDADDDTIPGPEMARLMAEYLADSRERTRSMSEAVYGLSGENASSVRRALRTEAHRLRGSGASFGIPEISRLAGEIEDLLARHGDDPELPVEGRARLSGLMAALHEKVSAAAGVAPLPDRHLHDRPPRVLLLDPADTELSASFSVVQKSTESVRAFDSLEALLDAAVAQRPDAILVAADRQDAGGLPAVRRLRQAGLAPVLVISSSSDSMDRLAAVRAGAEGFLPRPPDAAAALALVESYARPTAGTRVLAVDDDRLFLEVIAGALTPHAVAVEPCTDPAQVFPAIEKAAPELLVVDIELPGMSGIELTRMLRADPATRRLPVLVISSHDSVHARMDAFAAGADDFLAKPFEPDELAARIMAHLRRKLVKGRDPGRDPHTGVHGRSWLIEACERALALARRGGRPLALVGIDVGFSALQARHGPLAAEAVVDGLAAHLSASFRRSDLVARIAAGRVAALLHDLAAADAERLLLCELAAFGTRTFHGPSGPFRPELRGQLATFPDKATGGLALLEELEARLEAVPSA